MNFGYWVAGIVLAGSLLFSCHKQRTYTDSEIDPSVRDAVKVLNDKVLKSIIDRDTAALLSYCSERFVTQRKRKIVAHTGQVGVRLKSVPLEIRKQFYVVNSDSSKFTSVSSGIGDHDYTCLLRTPARDLFISIATLNDSLQTLALTLVYGRHTSEWKLEAIEFGLFDLLQKDAIDWFERSKNFYNKGHNVDAVCNLTLSSRVLKPANDIIVYNREKEIEAFRPVLEAAIADLGPYPLDISYVDSHPGVFNIFPQLNGEVYCPMLWYKTNLNLSDTAALSRECDAIHMKIGSRFRGLDQNNPYIFYRAFDRVSPQGSGKSVSFIRKTRTPL